MKSTRCRSCGSNRLKLVYDFGEQPLAGKYPTEPESSRPARRYPLDLTECANCGLWQVTNLPPIDEIFNDNYRYSSSTVPDLVRHFTGYADFLQQRLPAGASIFEFGCNDGVLLVQLQERGFACTGVDASDNVASLARQKGLDVKTGFLTPEFVESNHLSGKFDLVTCSNVFAHIDDIRTTTHAVKKLLKPGGIFNIEVHDGNVLAGESQFDTVYHEHLTYFTESTLKRFSSLSGFEYIECQRTPMHGGGLRFSSRLADAGATNASQVSSQPELIAGSDFTETIARCHEDLARLHRKHGPLYGYGAAGRAQMFINITGAADLFSCVFDDSPLRQGRYIVGTDVPIRPYGGEQGGCCVILAWNYASTISSRIHPNFSETVTLLPAFKAWNP
jgi:SAM-dependent methyltransferase